MVSPPYLVDTIRVGTTWADAVLPVPETPATKLVFTTQPTVGTAGNLLSPVVVRIRNDSNANMPSNNVPITVSLSVSGTFASGTTTVYIAHQFQPIIELLVCGPGCRSRRIERPAAPLPLAGAVGSNSHGSARMCAQPLFSSYPIGG